MERGADPAEIVAHAHTLGGYLNMWKMVDQWVFTTYYTTVQGRLFAAAGERELVRATFTDSLEIETGDDAPLRTAVAKFPASASYGLLDATRNLVSGG